MSDIADRYRTRADNFAAVIAAVRPDQWRNQSPCADWKAVDVVRHIVDMHEVMLQPLGRSLSPAPPVDDDPMGAFNAARADIEEVLADPEAARAEAQTPMGKMPVEEHIDGVVSADMVLHGWDLAKATGQEYAIPPEEIERAAAMEGAIPDELLRPIAYGPRVAVPDDATPQDKLLAFIGRDPNWRPA